MSMVFLNAVYAIFFFFHLYICIYTISVFDLEIETGDSGGNFSFRIDHCCSVLIKLPPFYPETRCFFYIQEITYIRKYWVS